MRAHDLAAFALDRRPRGDGLAPTLQGRAPLDGIGADGAAREPEVDEADDVGIGEALASDERTFAEPGVEPVEEDLGAAPAAFDERRKLIVRGLNAIPGVRCADPGGAFYAFPNIEGTGLDSRTFQRRLLEEAGVAVVSGTSFGALGEGYVRFSYAASAEAISEAMRRIRAFLAA